MKRVYGFTLVELLVVIVVIAVLAAILFPIFANAREKARQSSCLSNEKQIGMAIMQYVQDYDEQYPASSTYYPPNNFYYYTWAHVLRPYVKSTDVMICPSNRFSDQRWWGISYRWPNMTNQYLPRDYVCNGTVMRNGYNTCHGVPCTGLRVEQVSDPTGTVLITENKSASWDAGEYSVGDPVAKYANYYPMRDRSNGLTPANYDADEGNFQTHFGRVNFLFADGHAKAMKMIDTMQPTDMWMSGTDPTLQKQRADGIVPELR